MRQTMLILVWLIITEAILLAINFVSRPTSNSYKQNNMITTLLY